MAHSHRYYHFLLIFMLTFLVGASWGETEAEILLRFKNSLSNYESALSDWNESTATSPCTGDRPNWTGLRCTNNGKIFGLELESMGLKGVIDIETLKELPFLRTLSFMNNSFDGPFPAVNKLTSLRALYLSNNRFSGEISEKGFASMNSLQKVYLAHNNFSGYIPQSLASLPRLSQLSLEWNSFEGEIPDFRQKDLIMVDLAYNQLQGPIPDSLSKMNSSLFAGNKDLCGKPLPQCKSSKKRTIIVMIIIMIAIVGGSVVSLAVIAAVLFYIRTKSQSKKIQEQNARKEEAHHQPISDHHHYRKAKAKLYFVKKEERVEFELQDLLRASAEVLGSGSLGSSYKAVLLDGSAMVVKRFTHILNNNIGKKEFHEHMRKLGRMCHPNLLTPVAFCYRKEEKLLVSDFVPNGSLASHLHARRGPGGSGLDWPTRLKIIKGVAKGLAYLHKELRNLTIPHGHLKSSNVLLDNNFNPLLTDYGLVALVNKEQAKQLMVAYKSPEFTQYNHTTRKMDVWSLGIMILELLTGKFPANYLKQQQGNKDGNAVDLASWVNSVVREEWTGEVFDKDMKGTKNGEGEMLKLLKIGMCCCEWNVERRCDLKEAVEKIEELKERDSDYMDDCFSYGSEGEGYSSRAITEDDFSFSINA